MQRAVTQQANELVHQIRLSIMPAFILHIVAGTLKMRNIGNGVAINVQIDRLKLILAPEEAFTPNIVFTRALFLDRHEWVTIEHVQYQGEVLRPIPSVYAPSQNNYLDRVVGENATYRLNIRFQDIEANHYLQEVQMDKGGCNPGPVQRFT